VNTTIFVAGTFCIYIFSSGGYSVVCKVVLFAKKLGVLIFHSSLEVFF